MHRVKQVTVGKTFKGKAHESTGHELLRRDDFICETQLNGIIC